MRQAIVVSSPCDETTGRSPVLSSAKQPVPYVFFAVPGSKHAWPNSAACWSPAMPAIGTPRGSQPRSAVSPHGPDESTISGSTSRGTSNSAHIASSQSTVERFRQSVREALLTSVACTRPRVSFQSSQLSTVPNASWPRAARRRASGT